MTTRRPPSAVDDLLSQLNEAEKRVRSLKVQIREVQTAAAEFQVGQEVEVSYAGRDWEPAIVRSVEFAWPGADPWYVVSRRKKAGGWATSTIRVFERVRAAAVTTRHPAPEWAEPPRDPDVPWCAMCHRSIDGEFWKTGRNFWHPDCWLKANEPIDD